jgi:hypothetical protein
LGYKDGIVAIGSNPRSIGGVEESTWNPYEKNKFPKSIEILLDQIIRRKITLENLLGKGRVSILGERHKVIQ